MKVATLKALCRVCGAPYDLFYENDQFYVDHVCCFSKTGAKARVRFQCYSQDLESIVKAIGGIGPILARGAEDE